MPTIHIAELTRRYRLPPPRADEAGRLDRVLERALQENLELALARLGLDPGGEVCVRELRVPVRLRLSRGDGDLAVDWGLALAAGVRDALASGRDDAAVRYASRRQALADFAAGVARDELGRAWAWRQLGLSWASEHPSRAEAAQALAGALTAEPEAVVPILAFVARLGALPELLTAFGSETVAALARAAAVAAGASEALISEAGAQAGPASEAPWALDRSEIFREAAESVRGWPVGARRAVALLGLLEVEPARVRAGGEGARAILAGLEARERGALKASSAAEKASPSHSLAPQRGERAGVRGGQGPLEGRGEYVQGRGAPAAEGDPAAARTKHLPDGSPVVAAEPLTEASDPEPTPLPDLRTQGETDWGGLLFVLGLLEDLGFPQEALADEALTGWTEGGRPLRWVMHALAQTLVPLSPHDPAALAFAGLAPDRVPPSLEEPGSTQAERGLLEEWRDRVTATLEDRLPGAGRRGPALLRWVCRRPAAVVADPGWLEIRLTSKEVSTELRRAGLDLDPGWIPWLGVVVVFRYGAGEPWTQWRCGA